MNNEKFVGFYIIGTRTQQEAEEGKGLILWMQDEPSWFNKFYNKLFLGIRWVSKENYTPPVKPVVAEKATTKVEMPKQRSYKKKDNGPIQERRNSKPGFKGNRE
jgi:hypothetical protein